MPGEPTVDVSTPTGAGGMTAAAGWEEWEPGPYKKFPPRSQLLAEYWLMRTYEPTTKRVLALIRTLITSKLGAYRHPDAAITEKVNGWLGRLEGGVERTLGALLSGLWAGFAVAEKVWETSDSEWWVDRTPLLHPGTFVNTFASKPEDRDGIRLDEKSRRVERLTQYPRAFGQQTPVEHSVDDVLYWPLFRELQEQVYGQSLLAAARRAWFSKTRIENFWNTFVQKCAAPTPIFIVPSSEITAPDGRSKISIGKFLMQQWEKVEPGAAMALPMTEGLEPKVITLVPSDGAGVTFERLTQYWKVELFNSMITPRIILEEPEHASRAQTGTVLDLYYMLIDGIRQEIGTVLVEQLAAPLLAVNVGPDVEPGTWAWGPMQTSDMEMLSRVFETVERGKANAAMAGGPFVPADEVKRREAFPAIYAMAEEAPEAFEGGTGEGGERGNDGNAGTGDGGKANSRATATAMAARYR